MRACETGESVSYGHYCDTCSLLPKIPLLAFSCLLLLPQTDRMSRVCIVVLEEEEEDDSPTFISNLPQENVSVHPSPSGNMLVRHVVCWRISCL